MLAEGLEKWEFVIFMKCTHETRGNVECKDHHHNMYRERFILLMGIIHTCMYVFKSRELWPDVCTYNRNYFMDRKGFKIAGQSPHILPIEFYHSLEM